MKKNFFKTALAVLLIFAALNAWAGGSKESPAPAAAAAPAVPAFSAPEFVKQHVNGIPDNSGYIVSMDTFVADVIAGKDMYIVDIRSAADYEKGHLKGAVSVPWNTSAMWETIPYMPKGQTVYVHCYSGQTSGQAMILMRAAGIDAFSVNSGWNLGISRVEGYEAAVVTAPTMIDKSYNNGVSPQVMGIIRNYYQEVATHNGTPFANRFVSEDNAKAILDAKDTSVVFVDIRRADDFAKGKIAATVNIPYNPSFYDMAANLSSDKRLIVNCYSGQQSNQAVALLSLLGYDAVSLIYGMGTPRTAPRGWVNKNLPVVN